MKKRAYQYGYSEINPLMLDITGRERKAKTMLAVFKDYFTTLHDLSALNIGGSTGIIDGILSNEFNHVTSIDIDTKAIEYARKNQKNENISFEEGDATALNYNDNSFDVVICSQVYEHVPDAKQMMDEISRVLKPGGVCYFAATNRITLIEPHYHLPFLSIIPLPLAHLYLRLLGRGEFYHELHFTLWGLKKLVQKFNIHDYTSKILDEPSKFDVDYMLKDGSLKIITARFLVKLFYWLMPGYIWILEKPNSNSP
jgi:ubiquinone/menaquinone biosynthesis C-methylase UbiE